MALEGQRAINHLDIKVSGKRQIMKGQEQQASRIDTSKVRVAKDVTSIPGPREQHTGS